MRLIRLKINTPFRSLQADFEIYFLREIDYDQSYEFAPNILAGRNGSGKSNILEALGNIFYHLNCMYSQHMPDDFFKSEDEGVTEGFENERCVVDAFELEYFIALQGEFWGNQYAPTDKARICIRKEAGKTPVFEWLDEDTDMPRPVMLDRKTKEALLPRYVLGYSSGENELLSLPFFKTRFLHYDEYVDSLRHRQMYGNPPKPEGKLVYLDQEYTQAILLTNLLMQDEEVLTPFREEVGIEGIAEFRLVIWEEAQISLSEEIQRSMRGLPEWMSLREVGITYNLYDSIDALKRCTTCWGYETDAHTEQRYLVLDYKVTPATKEAFRHYFGNNPLQLFQLFQVLLALNAHVVSPEDKKRVYLSQDIFINQDIYPNPLERDRILRIKNLWVRKQGIAKPLFTKQLSDGEHQFLHSLGLCLLFRNEPCLFLLDEPETHFNPDWKAKFISSLRHCFAQNQAHDDSATMREVLITTHSPYLISDSEARHVHVFTKDAANQHATCRRPDFETLGTSVNKITIRIFDKADTIGAYANKMLDRFKEQLKNAATVDQKEALLEKVQNKFGDSVEQVLFVNQILDEIEDAEEAQ